MHCATVGAAPLICGKLRAHPNQFSLLAMLQPHTVCHTVWGVMVPQGMFLNKTEQAFVLVDYVSGLGVTSAVLGTLFFASLLVSSSCSFQGSDYCLSAPMLATAI